MTVQKYTEQNEGSDSNKWVKYPVINFTLQSAPSEAQCSA